MAEHFYEIEVKARDASGAESVVHAEYSTQTASPYDAAREMLDHAIKQRGNSRVREIDPAR